MLWYEATVESSISLCRSLLAGNDELLKRFDEVLTSNGMDALAKRDVIGTGLQSVSEASAELEWLKEFLQNVHQRNLALGLSHKGRSRAADTENNDTASPLTGVDQQTDSTPDDGTDNSERSPQESFSVSRTETSSGSVSEIEGNLPLGPQNVPAGTKQPTALNGAQNTVDHDTKVRKPLNPQGPRIRNLRHRKQLPTTAVGGAERAVPSPVKTIGSSRILRAHRFEPLKVTAAIRKSPLRREAVRDSRPKENASSRRATESGKSEKAEQWCLCRRPSFGEMVACDNSKCPYEWYHLKCVGLKKVPKVSVWICPVCQNSLRKTPAGAARRRIAARSKR